MFEDADLDLAVTGAIAGIFAATGQICVAGSRLLVQNSVKDEVVRRLLDLAAQARIGDPMRPDVHVGPVTTGPQFDKILNYIDIARAEGARCVLGGKRACGPGLDQGHFIEPTIFVDVTNDMRIAQEEVFGPVLAVIGFEDEDEAIRIGNDVIYGLAAGVWTRDIGRAIRMTRALRAGMHWQSYTRRPRGPQPLCVRAAASSCFSGRIGPIRLMSGFDGPALQVYDSFRPLAGSPTVLRDYQRLRRQASCFFRFSSLVPG